MHQLISSKRLSKLGVKIVALLLYGGDNPNDDDLIITSCLFLWDFYFHLTLTFRVLSIADKNLDVIRFWTNE